MTTNNPTHSVRRKSGSAASHTDAAAAPDSPTVDESAVNTGERTETPNNPTDAPTQVKQPDKADDDAWMKAFDVDFLNQVIEESRSEQDPDNNTVPTKTAQSSKTVNRRTLATPHAAEPSGGNVSGQGEDLFRAEVYLQKKYPDALSFSGELQSIVESSGLESDPAFVTSLLDGVVKSPGEFESNTKEIHTAIAVAASLRAGDGQWASSITSYLKNLSANDRFVPAVFYDFIAPGLRLDQSLQLRNGRVDFTTPDIIMYNPVIETTKKGIAWIGGDPYEGPYLNIGFGLFGFMARVTFSGSNNSGHEVGLLQYVESNRIATYADGTQVTWRFPRSLDTSRPPWYQGKSVQITSDESASIFRTDSPNWLLPHTIKRQPLTSVSITDRFTSYLAVKTGEQEYLTLDACEWQFTAAYHGRTSNQSFAKYEVTPSDFANEIINILENPATAQKYDATITNPRSTQ
ncbi:hypothetical protein AB0F17_56425 [Nonomuraea sp. NPDC026600]|uniref:hypothetical protein n=1 Tax=Nonomuraea sp. NPDC026600 TaxID=3155363 RepID=UPI003403E9C5